MQIRSVFEVMLMEDQTCVQQRKVWHVGIYFFKKVFICLCFGCLRSWLPLISEDEMVGWHHQLDGHEFEQAPGVGDGQGSLAFCSPCGRKTSDMTE